MIPPLKIHVLGKNWAYFRQRDSGKASGIPTEKKAKKYEQGFLGTSYVN